MTTYGVPLPRGRDDESLHTDIECLYDISKGTYLIAAMCKSLVNDPDGSLTLSEEELVTLVRIGTGVLAVGITVEEMLHKRGLCLLEDPDIADLPLPMEGVSIHNNTTNPPTRKWSK